MRNETARLLRAVLQLVEKDVRELADTMVEIDEREAAHFAELQRLRSDVDMLARYFNAARPASFGYSVKVPPS